MKTTHSTLASFVRRTPLILVLLAIFLTSARAQVPEMISYQGRVLMNDTNFNGIGHFKFALVAGGPSGEKFLWKNANSFNNSEPIEGVELNVVNGLFMVLLGDSTLDHMNSLPVSVFETDDVWLRVWFDGGAGYQQLAPDQRIVSVGYAMMAGNVPDGAITAKKLANGAITSAQITDASITAVDLAPNSVNSTHLVDGQVMSVDLGNSVVTSDKVADGSLLGIDLADGSVGTAQLADSIALGAANIDGRLDVYSTTVGTPSITLFGNGNRISTYGNDGLEQIRLWGTGYGEMLLNNGLANNATTVRLSAQEQNGGLLELGNADGVNRAVLEGQAPGGRLVLTQSDGHAGAVLYGEKPNTGAGSLSLYQADGSGGLRAHGGPLSGSLQLINRFDNISMHLWNYDNEEGMLSVRNSSGGETGYLWGRDSFGGSHGQMGLKKSDGTETITLQAAEGPNGSQMLMRKADGTISLQLDAEVGSGGGGYVDVRKANGDITIILNGETGTTTTKVLEITGGADLSENFNINTTTPEPGMIVSIDPHHPGELALSTEAYDKKVAGIISGAGGVNPGMLMSQRGSAADGEHPVALTGRVYCWVDAGEGGAIEPGDLLTTSNTPGHGMKVGDHARAQGGIIGKAMTALDSGKGLVLVLVTLQ